MAEQSQSEENMAEQSQSEENDSDSTYGPITRRPMFDNIYYVDSRGRRHDITHNLDMEGILTEPDRSSSKLTAIFLLVNAALGAGLLNFPQAFDEAGGITSAVLVQLVLLVFISAGLLILGYASEKYVSDTLHETITDAFGTAGAALCSLLTALYCYFTCVTFILIIGDQYDKVMMALVGPDFCLTWYMNRRYIVTLTILVFVLPLCCSKTIGFLKYASSLGFLAVVYLVGLVVVQYYTGNYIPGPIKTQPEVWTDVFKVVPAICFGYQCHVTVVTVYASMEDRRPRSRAVVVGVTLIICAVAYTVTGVYGYLTFGSTVEADVLVSYSQVNGLVLIGVVTTAIKTITAYPIMVFCAREALISFWETTLETDYDVTNEKRRRYKISIYLVILTLPFVDGLSGLDFLIDALGFLAAIFIFIFPGLCLLKLCLDELVNSRLSRLCIPAAVMFLAVGAFVIGLVGTQIVQRNNMSQSAASNSSMCVL